MKLGDKIRSYRKKAGLTQNELAEIIHITPQAVSNWERNERVPDLALFPLLSRAIGIRYDELFNGKELEFYPEKQKEFRKSTEKRFFEEKKPGKKKPEKK